MDDWRPIGTAPRDVTHILAFIPRGRGGLENYEDLMYVVMWKLPDEFSRGRYWVEVAGERCEIFEPTHWKPLPNPPKRNVPGTKS